MAQAVTEIIETFFEKFRVRSYAKGQVLLLNGEQSEYVFFIEKGKVKQYDVSYRGDEIILNVYKPGAFFPLSLAIANVPNKYIYEAETDIEIRQAPASEVVTFLKTNPEVLYDLMQRVYRGTEGLLGRMVYLMAGSAQSRLIYELLIEARRFGTVQPDGSCRITINEKELGARAGLSRETVSREMHVLKRENLVTTVNKVLAITNVAKLEQKLGKEV